MAYTEFTTSMGNEQGTVELNGRFDKGIGHIHDGSDMNGGIISYNDLKDKPTTIAAADKLSTPRNINGVPFDGRADITIDVSAASAMVGTVDNIVNGMEVTAGAGLQAVVGIGRAIIDETVVSFMNPLAITLEPRMASLIYTKYDKTIGKVDAKLPTAFIDNNTVGFWDFTNSDTVSSTPNSAVGISSVAVANNIVWTNPTPGTSLKKVDGHCGYAMQGDGATGYGASANFTNVPLGDNPVHIVHLYTCHGTNTAIQSLVHIGTASGMFGTFVGVDNVLYIGAGAGNTYSTSFVFTFGNTYLIDLLTDGVNCKVFINGDFVWQYSGDWVNVIALGTVRIGSWYTGTQFDKGAHHFLEIRNSLRTPSQIAQISNNLLLPCQYIDNGVTKDIRSILPANSISLGYTKTSFTAVTEIDDGYKYGIRVGAYNGNRRTNPDTLGWKYSTGTVSFDNPFATSNVRVDVYIKITADATTWTRVPSAGVSVNPLKINLTSTGAGYVSIIAEVIE